jgi:hypothetical protein
MAASCLGLMPQPTPGTAEAEIEHMRLVMHPGSTASMPTHPPQIAQGLASIGASLLPLGMDLASIDSSLGRGHPVLLAGDPKQAWGLAMANQGNYLATYRAVADFGHWICIFGKTNNGLYVVGDPLSKIGAMTVTGSQLETFVADGRPNGWSCAREVAPGRATATARSTDSGAGDGFVHPLPAASLVAAPGPYRVDQLAYLQQLQQRRPDLIQDPNFPGVGYQTMMMRPAWRGALLSGQETPATLEAKSYPLAERNVDQAWMAGQRTAWASMTASLNQKLDELGLPHDAQGYGDPRVLASFPVQPAAYNPSQYVGYRVGAPIDIRDSNGLTWLSYICFKSPSQSLSPALFQGFMAALGNAGFHGDAKIVVGGPPGETSGETFEYFQYNNIIVHGRAEADGLIAEATAQRFFGSSIASMGRGLDVADLGKGPAVTAPQDVWSVYLLKHGGDVSSLPAQARQYVRYH